MVVGTRVHDTELAHKLFPEGIPWDVEKNGIERCAYCGSINPEVLLDDTHKVEYIGISDDGQKMYYKIDEQQYKLYNEHVVLL